MCATSMELTALNSKPGRKEESDDSPQNHAKSFPTGVTLIPQPSDDADDPLVCPGYFYSTFTCHVTLPSAYNP